MVADCTAADGWRMTGSAFASYERRGTLCSGWLRRINSVRKGEVWRGMVPDRTSPNGWRMTGSAFARYERCGTLWMRVAPQDILTSVLNREGGWVPQRI